MRKLNNLIEFGMMDKDNIFKNLKTVEDGLSKNEAELRRA